MMSVKKLLNCEKVNFKCDIYVLHFLFGTNSCFLFKNCQHFYANQTVAKIELLISRTWTESMSKKWKQIYHNEKLLKYFLKVMMCISKRFLFIFKEGENWILAVMYLYNILQKYKSVQFKGGGKTRNLCHFTLSIFK